MHSDFYTGLRNSVYAPSNPASSLWAGHAAKSAARPRVSTARGAALAAVLGMFAFADSGIFQPKIQAVVGQVDSARFIFESAYWRPDGYVVSQEVEDDAFMRALAHFDSLFANPPEAPPESALSLARQALAAVAHRAEEPAEVWAERLAARAFET